MGLVARALERFGYMRVKELTYLDPNWANSGIIPTSETELKNPYSQHEWVYACVNSIMKRVASVPFRLKSGNALDPTEITSGDLYQVFQQPNQFFSTNDLWVSTTAHMLLDGNALWIIDRVSPTSPPRRIWVRKRDRFEPVFKRGELVQWKYKLKDGGYQFFESYQIVFFFFYNPDSTFWGIGPLEAARQAAEQDRLASLFNRSFFENSCNPGGVLKVNYHLEKKKRRQLLQNFEGRHQGVNRGFKTILLEGDASFEPLQINYKDMLFVQLAKLGRDKICAVMGVPPTEVGIHEQVHKSTAKEVHKKYWESTIIPIQKLYVETLAAQLFLPLNRVRIWCEFDRSGVECLQEDRDKKVDRAFKVWTMGVPFNEVNKREGLGYEKIKGGDKGYLPLNMVPVGEHPTGAQYQAPPVKIIEPPKRRLIELPQSKALTLWSEEHVLAYKEWTSKTVNNEYTFYRRLRQYLQNVKSWLLATLGLKVEEYQSLANIPDDALDLPKSFDDKLRKIADKHYKQVIDDVAEYVTEKIHAIEPGFVYEEAEDQILNHIKTKKIKIVDVNQRIKEKVRERLLEAQREGKTVRELADSIANIIKDDRNRALRIARTETAQASNGILYECELSAGIQRHQWVANIDERTRDTHIANMELGPYEVNAVYPNGCRYPGDINGPAKEVVNCRCTIIPME